MAQPVAQIFRPAAEQAGYDAGQAVLAGRLSAEAAGDRWVRVADSSHGAGQAWLRGFDSTGVAR